MHPNLLKYKPSPKKSTLVSLISIIKVIKVIIITIIIASITTTMIDLLSNIATIASSFRLQIFNENTMRVISSQQAFLLGAFILLSDKLFVF